MTEYRSTGESNEEMASAFIVSTCQLIPKSSLVHSDEMHNLLASQSPAPNEYSILCGSHAEFYIRPLITCIDDKDVLIAQTEELVFNGEFLVLPADLSGLADTIVCFMIEPYDKYLGFVRLRVLGEMNYNWKINKYEFNYAAQSNSYAGLNLVTISETYYPITLERSILPNIISGPAIKQRSDEPIGYLLEIDFVKSMWCPLWPKEAHGWLNRPRKYGWPPNDTILEVAQTGCNLVYIQHRSCRNDKLQWRFSFSLAEVILLQSWTQAQQIVYHLLRFFAKRELIQKDCPKEDEVLCTYHLKTLMLWTCEEKPTTWWNSASVIGICSELLEMLAEWFKQKNCPNYFIPKANLFHEQPRSKILERTEKRLKEFSNSGVLCQWFVENYILSFIRRHFEPASTRETMPHLFNYMLPLLEMWKVNELYSVDVQFNAIFECCHSSRFLLKCRYNSGLRQSFKKEYHFRNVGLKSNWTHRELPIIQNVLCFMYYGNLLHTMQTVYGLDCGEISWESSLFVEFINTISMQPKTLRSQYHNFPKTYTTQGSRFQFLRAQGLLENLTGTNTRAEFLLLSLLIKQFLAKTLEHDDTVSNGFAPATLTYLAALRFATSEYQEATLLCSSVPMDKTSEKNKETLNAGCLLFIDDVARIVGLSVLQKRITENGLHYINRRIYLDLRLSPEVFAQYLSVLSAERMFTHSNFYHSFPDSSFPMDVNLKALIKPKCIFLMKPGSHFNPARQIVHRRPDSFPDNDSLSVNPTIVKERVLDALMEYAEENMNLFYSSIYRDFGVKCNTAVCYRALYLYKYRQYDKVLHLCERILNESDLQKDLKAVSFANVLLLPPLSLFFDRDVQYMLGFHTLCYYLSPLNDDMGKVEFSSDPTFNHWFARCVYTYMGGLVISLQYRYSIKCHYFLGRHFLARYLKVRCYIDCNLPYSEALTEFAVQKTNLPFEHIIRRFLLRKLAYMYAFKQ